MSSTARQIASTVGVEIDRQLTGGLWGAYLGTARDGATVVIKVLPEHPLAAYAKVKRAVGLVELLRRSGYPAPRYLLVDQVDGQCVTVQEFVRGTTPEVFRAGHAERLIELWRCHRGAAGPVVASFDPLAMYRSDESVDCRELQQATDPLIRRLYDEARSVVAQSDVSLFRSGDIMHGDFHHWNFLAVDGQITAVIDWEGAGTGDSRIDLCELAWASHPGSPTRSAEADQILSATVAAEVDTSVAMAIAAGRAIEKMAFGLRTGQPTLSAVLASVAGYLQPMWRTSG